MFILRDNGTVVEMLNWFKPPISSNTQTQVVILLCVPRRLLVYIGFVRYLSCIVCNHLMTKQTIRHVCPAMNKISLGISAQSDKGFPCQREESLGPFPANTQRCNNVVTTSLQRRDVAVTL